jgi:hypothetical protein
VGPRADLDSVERKKVSLLPLQVIKPRVPVVQPAVALLPFDVVYSVLHVETFHRNPFNSFRAEVTSLSGVQVPADVQEAECGREAGGRGCRVNCIKGNLCLLGRLRWACSLKERNTKRLHNFDVENV